MIQPPSQQATRHARRVYVGGLPPTANEQSIATFFSHALAAVGGTSSGPGVVGKDEPAVDATPIGSFLFPFAPLAFGAVPPPSGAPLSCRLHFFNVAIAQGVAVKALASEAQHSTLLRQCHL